MRGGLEPVGDVSVGDWIAGRLGGPVGTVGSVVPRGFAAHARVLHPVELHDGRPSLTWAQVCAVTGRIPHALMQWAAITEGQTRWDDGDVRVGNLAPSALDALLDVLSAVTGGQVCWHALWEGWGWVDGSGVRLHLPSRDYLLFRGPLRAALRMGWHPAPGWFEPQSPSLLWPSDHSWCVATEIDFDSTLVGGSGDLIAAVLAAPGLDAWPVEPDDDLTATGDLRNASA